MRSGSSIPRARSTPLGRRRRPTAPGAGRRRRRRCPVQSPREHQRPSAEPEGRLNLNSLQFDYDQFTTEFDQIAAHVRDQRAAGPPARLVQATGLGSASRASRRSAAARRAGRAGDRRHSRPARSPRWRLPERPPKPASRRARAARRPPEQRVPWPAAETFSRWRSTRGPQMCRIYAGRPQTGGAASLRQTDPISPKRPDAARGMVLTRFLHAADTVGGADEWPGDARTSGAVTRSTRRPDGR